MAHRLNTNKQFMVGNGILAFAVIFVVVIFVYMSMRLQREKQEERHFIESYNTPEYKLSYVNKMRTYLNKLFSFAVKQNLIERNPVSSIPNFKRPDELKEEMQFYTPDEWKRFVQAFPKDDIMYYTICCTLYYMGMRRGEVLALNRKDDVDIVKGTIRVNKTVSQYVSGQRYVVTPPKTKNSYRVIKMPEEELQIMKKYL